MTNARLPNIHPGEVLYEDFLVPLGISQNALSIAVGVPATRISDIVRGKRGISADTALRLARYFDTSPEFWLNLQMLYDLEAAQEAAGRALERIEPAQQIAAPEEPTLASFGLVLPEETYLSQTQVQVVSVHHLFARILNEDRMPANDYSYAMAS